MPFVIADRIKETTASTGTGDIALGGAQTGFKAFNSFMQIDDSTWYAIVDAFDQAEWEVGLGTYSAINTLTRTNVFSSSNNNLPVVFDQGVKFVYCDLPASQINTGGSGNAPFIGFTGSLAGGANQQFNNANIRLYNNDATKATVMVNGVCLTPNSSYTLSGMTLTIYDYLSPDATIQIIAKPSVDQIGGAPYIGFTGNATGGAGQIFNSSELNAYGSNATAPSVMVNGVCLTPNIDYTLFGANLTITDYLSPNATIQVIAKYVVGGGGGSGNGTVTEVDTGTGLTGGPISISGTISLIPPTGTSIGGVKADGTTITIDPNGTISAVQQGGGAATIAGLPVEQITPTPFEYLQVNNEGTTWESTNVIDGGNY